MTIKPVRIQRSRAAGYNMQTASQAINGLGCINVTRPGRWGNPYDVEIFGRQLSLTLFRNSLDGVWSPRPLKDHSDELCDTAYAAHTRFMQRFRSDHPSTAARSELRGHNLGCYCRPEDACHADILLEHSNGDSR